MFANFSAFVPEVIFAKKKKGLCLIKLTED